MTLNKACKELIEELNRENLTEEERSVLEKYKMWLFGIKSTVSNNTEKWHPASEEPTEEGRYVVTIESENGERLISTADWWSESDFGSWFVDYHIGKIIAWKKEEPCED